MIRSAIGAMSVAVLSVAVVGVGELKAAEAPEVRSVRVPDISPRTTVGGEVAFEVTVAADGRVQEMTVLRSTPPYTEAMRDALERWRFERLPEYVGSRTSMVLVVGVFRHRAPEATAPGPGEGPKNVAASEAVPMPVALPTPEYPPRAVGQGTAVLRLRVGPQGAVTATELIEATRGFEDAVLDAVNRWSFRGTGEEGTAYAVIVLPALELPPPQESEPLE